MKWVDIPRVYVLALVMLMKVCTRQRRAVQIRDDGGEVLWWQRWDIPSLQHLPLGRLGFGVGCYSGGGEPR
jgi:hypothetical protein